MPADYQPLSTDVDRDRELNDAFDDDDEDDSETTPLAQGAGRQPASSESSYDFEREFASSSTHISLLTTRG